MGRVIETGVTGGAPNLLGSFTASARALPEGIDWLQFGTSHIPENCGFPWVWQRCTEVAEIPATPCVNEIQELTIAGADGGDFTLTFSAETTTPIPYGSTAGDVQTALEALSNVDPGDIVVAGGPNVYTFTFGGQYDCTNVDELVADCEGLTGPEAGEPTVDLLTAATYGVLAGTPDVSNTGFTVVDGDLGIHPAAAVIGFPPGIVTGSIEAATAAALQAKTDLTAAYLDAEGRASDFALAPDIGGSTLAPGVHTTDGSPASLGITGTVTLDAAGDPNAVWIFQIESTLITAPGAVVALINGAQACNVFWQVGSSATIDTTTEFAGTILALTSITALTNANVDGRLLARNGTVILDDNDVTVPECIVVPPTPITCDVETTVQGSAEDDGSFVDKPLNVGVEPADFKPFLVEYNAQTCPGGIPIDHAALVDRAKRGLAVRVGNAIARALSSSAPDGQPNDSPNLPESATDITPVGGPAPLVNTIAGLIEEAYECGATGELFIFAPAWTLPHFLEHTQLTQVGNQYKLGPHTVVFDQGYTNEAPTGAPAAGIGEAWIYVSGPFEYATGAVTVLEDTTGGVSPRLNRANVIVAQPAIYRFDPCCIFASRAEVC